MNTPFTPPGATFCGRGEAKGHGYYQFLDHQTGSNFCVPEEQATEAMIIRAQRECRDRFAAAGSAFAPVV